MLRVARNGDKASREPNYTAIQVKKWTIPILDDILEVLKVII